MLGARRDACDEYYAGWDDQGWGAAESEGGCSRSAVIFACSCLRRFGGSDIIQPPRRTCKTSILSQVKNIIVAHQHQTFAKRIDIEQTYCTSTPQSPFRLPRLALLTLSFPAPLGARKSSGTSFQFSVTVPDTGRDPRFCISSSLLVSYSFKSPLAFLRSKGCISLLIPSELCPLTRGGAGRGRSTKPPGVHFQFLVAGGSKLGGCCVC